jgi:hypothetical protein
MDKIVALSGLVIRLNVGGSNELKLAQLYNPAFAIAPRRCYPSCYPCHGENSASRSIEFGHRML